MVIDICRSGRPATQDTKAALPALGEQVKAEQLTDAMLITQGLSVLTFRPCDLLHVAVIELRGARQGAAA